MPPKATETAVTLVQIVRFCAAHGMALPRASLDRVQTGCALGVAELARCAPGATLAAVALAPWQTAVDAAELRRLWAASARTHGREIAVECARIDLDDARSVVTFACRAASDLGDAIERMVRYWPLATTAFGWTLESRRRETVAAAQADVRESGDRLAVEFLVANLVHSGRKLTREPWAPRAVRLPFIPPSGVRRRMEELTGCEVRGGYPRLELLFDNDDLALDVPRSLSPAAAELVTALADRALAGAGRGRFTDAVRVVAEAELARGRPSAPQIAELCGMSLRSFHRHLEAEGTSFRRVLDGVLFARAEVLLADERRTVAAVARELDFADASSLLRAFRRWTATTPRRHQAP